MNKNEQIENIINNSKNLFDSKIGTKDEYTIFDVTKSTIEDYFKSGVLLDCIDIQPANESENKSAFLYRKDDDSNTQENKGYPTISFKMVKHDVNFDLTRTFNASISEVKDNKTVKSYGIDIEKEINYMISYEAKADFERYINTYLLKLAITSGNVTILNKKDISTNSLLTHINILANNIAIKTRRGAANFCIASSRICNFLLNDERICNLLLDKEDFIGVGSFRKVGYINDNKQMLICDSYATNDYILMGYKGNITSDSGIVLCPNTMFMIKKLSDRREINSNFGICSDDMSKDYYHVIKFN